MENLALVVVLPLGPDHNLSHVLDTLHSVQRYAPASRKLILMDDSGTEAGEELRAMVPELLVVKTPQRRGRCAGLYLTNTQGFNFAVQNFAFDVLLKMDTDSVMTGPHAEEIVIRTFQQNPALGSLGSHKVDCMGNVRNHSHHENVLYEETCDAHLIMNPERAPGIHFLRETFQKARRHGYQPGEHCQGGAYFMSYECIRRMREQGYFDEDRINSIAWTRIEDDVLFSLFMCVTGLKNGDLATGDLPLGVKWKGLPCSPEELLARNKKIIHSVRYYQDWDEVRIRAFFRQRREESRPRD